jgi:hypothetical protein
MADMEMVLAVVSCGFQHHHFARLLLSFFSDLISQSRRGGAESGMRRLKERFRRNGHDETGQ